jgi:hypothetical protein
LSIVFFIVGGSGGCAATVADFCFFPEFFGSSGGDGGRRRAEATASLGFFLKRVELSFLLDDGGEGGGAGTALARGASFARSFVKLDPLVSGAQSWVLVRLIEQAQHKRPSFVLTKAFFPLFFLSLHTQHTKKTFSLILKLLLVLLLFTSSLLKSPLKLISSPFGEIVFVTFFFL